MRLWLSWFAAVVCGLIVSTAEAQFGNNLVANTSLASRLRWVQLEVIGGRLTTSSLHVGTNMNSTTVGEGGRRERLTIDLTNPSPNVNYELTDKTREMQVSIADGEQISIRNLLKGDQGTRSIVFTQFPHKDLSLSIEGPDGKRTVTGPTLWHLLLAEPEVTQTMLAPTLEMLRPGWKLSTVTDAIEETLVRNARLQRKSDRHRWEQWVENLSSQRYSDRQAAERELTETGREVLPYLRGLDRNSLDAEQWRRTRNVIASLDGEQGDSVDQIVTLLAGDARAWVSLLNRDDESIRRVALEQLRSMTGEAIEFDVAAAPEARAAALQKLRERFSPPAAGDEPTAEPPND